MAKIHVVTPGEHASSIAAQHGYSDFETLWNLDANRSLRETRKDPHQLVPEQANVKGDRVTFGAVRVLNYERQTGKTHTFTVKIDKLKLRFQLCDAKRTPLAAAPCKIVAGASTSELATDNDGIIEAAVPRDCREGTLEVGGNTYRLDIGALEPISTRRGQMARLNNLGCWYGDDDDPEDPNAMALAIELFQSDYGLKVTGKSDAEFLSELGRVHDGKE